MGEKSNFSDTKIAISRSKEILTRKKEDQKLHDGVFYALSIKTILLIKVVRHAPFSSRLCKFFLT